MSVLLCVHGRLEIEIIEYFSAIDPPIEITRRCADNVELLASAEAGLGSVAVVSQMDLMTASQLHAAGMRIVGIAGEDGVDGERGCDGMASPFASDVAACIRNLSSAPPRVMPPESTVQAAGAGRIVAVWGSGGSPGRSTIARDLSQTLARSSSTLLIDADVYHPSLSQMLALSQETSAIVAAFRALNTGERGHHLIERSCAQIADFSFLAGLNSGARWRELSESVAEELWPIVRTRWDWTVVDCAAPAERDEYSYQGQRDGLTLSLLENADDVLLVGKPGAVGIRRLLDQVDVARELGVEARIVVNEAGRDRAAVTDLLRSNGVTDVLWVRADPGHMRMAVESGKLLAEAAPGSAALRDIEHVAASLGAVMEGAAGRTRRRFSRVRSGHVRSSKGRRSTSESLALVPDGGPIAVPEEASDSQTVRGRHRRIS
ncbi:AAA family ATPase [Ancrocorticia populi]|uniref:CobQ/CobB/MinD/ParA nucleotide binding domain-containing protein n=1 Tax=Ancrocorticia populi TaxID=2175228 RepID=A0A2V1K8X2_9ACTO|nr:hypothetical protein [Ancrocorticia populi]PWF25906.1 hypothetical protein DD236_07290 [Ancrocorticia populi]